MLQSQEIEELLCVVSSMDRDTLKAQFHAYRGNFPLDFTPEFLDAAPLERLQHIFVAVCLQNQRMPDVFASHAA